MEIKTKIMSMISRRNVPRLIVFLSFLFLLPLQAQRKKKKAEQPAFSPELYSSLEYREIGPFRGGRAAAVTGVPGQPKLFYFGATGGGVWKTEDGGITYKNISDGYFGGSIGAIAVAKSDPNVIYVGGGEVTVRGNVSSGYGMWKSVDAGKTWTSIGLPQSRHIPRIVIDPQNPDIVYTAVLGNIYKPTQERGVYKSINGGKTWKKVLFANSLSGAVELVMDPSNPRNLYAATWRLQRTPYSLSSGGEGSALWKSTDRGASWTEISKHDGFAKGTLGIIGVTVSPINADRVWAIVENKDKPFKINEIISSIFILKSLLFITSILSIIIIGNFDVFYDDRQLLTLLMLCGIGEVLFPIWFFQGVENLKPATIIVFISRIFLLIGTLIFVKNDQNVQHYVILFVSSSLLMGLLGFFYILRYFDLKIRLVSIRKLKGYFKESLPFFIGRFLSLAFNFGTIFFIGKFCLLEDVTGFDTSLKIVMLGVIPFEMLQQAVFPTISRTKNKKLLRNLVYFSMLVGTIIGTIIFLFSEHFMVWFGGIEMLQFSNALKILSILCPFVSLTFILGTCSLVAFGFHKEYNLSLIITSLIYVFILLALFFFNKITFWNLIYLRLFGDVLDCFWSCFEAMFECC